MENLAESLEWAADFAARNKLFDAPMKSNGYPVDGWKGPTAEERTSIILSLAKEVMKVEDEKFLQDLLYDLHETSKQTNEDDILRYVNSVHNSVFIYMRGKASKDATKD